MLTSPYAIPPVTPPAEHPRLMLRAEDLPRIRANIAEDSAAVTYWRELPVTPLVKTGATPQFGNYHLRDYLILEAKAFDQLLSPNPIGARALIGDLIEALQNFTVNGGNMGARWGGHLIFTAAEIYDWCYTFLIEEERLTVIAECERIAEQYFEMGYPPARQMAISGHGSEAQLLRDLLALSIAVYDERPDIYNYCAGRIYAEYVPEYNAIYASGLSSQGPSYAAYRYTCLLWSELLMRPLSGEALYTCTDPMAQGLRYMRRPDGEAMRLGDDFYELKNDHTRAHPFAVPLFLAYAATGREDLLADADGIDGYLLPDHFGMDYYKGGSWGEGLISPVSYLIFKGMTPPAPSRNTMPYCYFGSPVGLTVYRDSERMVMMKIGEFWGANHDHLDTGCFQLWFRGALTGESGVYDGYHDPHRKHYLIRTCAHNCLTVRAPQMPPDCGFDADLPNDGGTRRPCGGKEPKTYAIFQENYRMAKDLAHSESEDELMLSGDLTPAYAHTCEKVTRTMRFYPNRGEHGIFEVVDEVTALSPDYEKAFLLHCHRPPIIEGNTIILENGKTRLCCRILKPQHARITVIGGEDMEYFNDGSNYPPPHEQEHAELGWGRVVISPTSPALTDRFHVEMELCGL